MPWSLNIVSHVVVIPKHDIILLIFHIFNLSTAMYCNLNIWFAGYVICNPKVVMNPKVVENCCSSGFQVLALKLRSWTHIQFIFVQDEREESPFILLYVDIEFSSLPLLKETVSSPSSSIWHLYQDDWNHWLIFSSIYTPILFQWSICPFLFYSLSTSIVTMAL